MRIIYLLFCVYFGMAAPLLADPKVKQVVTGVNHSCALFDDGSLYCWGQNNIGQLGMADNVQRPLPTLVPTGQKKITALSSKFSHTCAIFEEGTLKCWGYNQNGQLGLGTTLQSVGTQFNQDVEHLPVVKLGNGRKVKKVSVGLANTCAILDDNSTKCWGDNSYGQLGLGDQKMRGQSPSEMGDNLPSIYFGEGQYAIETETGSLFTCAILQNNTMKCWGNNSRGQLGLETSYTPVGIGFNQAVHQLPVLRLGKDRKVFKMVSAHENTCVILDKGEVKCWGGNKNGLLGQGISNTNAVIGNASGQMGDTLPPVSLVPDLGTSHLSCSGYHCCAILENNAIKCWGYNNSGQLGLGDSKTRGLSIDDMGTKLPYINLGNLVKVTSLSASGSHTCASLGDGTLRCWGHDGDGQLGTGNYNDIGTSPNHMGDKLLPLIFKKP